MPNRFVTPYKEYHNQHSQINAIFWPLIVYLYAWLYQSLCAFWRTLYIVSCVCTPTTTRTAVKMLVMKYIFDDMITNIKCFEWYLTRVKKSDQLIPNVGQSKTLAEIQRIFTYILYFSVCLWLTIIWIWPS